MSVREDEAGPWRAAGAGGGGCTACPWTGRAVVVRRESKHSEAVRD